jgi:hypothetical protein
MISNHARLVVCRVLIIELAVHGEVLLVLVRGDNDILG